MRRQFNWRWFPLCLISAMGFVFVVNAYMVYAAVSTFPGDAGKDGFELSNDYDRVLTRANRQAALGWRLEGGTDAARHPVLRLTDNTGAPLPPGTIEATAERPIGPVETTELRFRSSADGRYMTDSTLPRGQWDVLVKAYVDGRLFTATKRIVVN